MKRILIILFLQFFAISCSYAGGGITHMYIAHESFNQLPEAKLQSIIRNNLDAYLVGAYYPDSGYMPGARYGEETHGAKFLDAFVTYLKTSYQNPIEEAPKLVAFLMGVITHYRSDRILHFVFYDYVSARDFKGDWNLAHQYGDAGIDLLLDVEKNGGCNKPKVWWVPVKDLLAVYQLMGSNYTASEITQGNLIISVAGTGERMISYPTYPYLRYWRMPWTSTNYQTWPAGGLRNNVSEVIETQMEIWRRLIATSETIKLSNRPLRKDIKEDLANMPIYRFARAALESGAMKIFVITNRADGSVEWADPIIQDANKLKNLVTKLYEDLKRH